MRNHNINSYHLSYFTFPKNATKFINRRRIGFAVPQLHWWWFYLGSFWKLFWRRYQRYKERMVSQQRRQERKSYWHVFVKMFPPFCFCSFWLSHTETTNISEDIIVAARMILVTEFDQAKTRVAKIMVELGLAGTLERRNVPDGSPPA